MNENIDPVKWWSNYGQYKYATTEQRAEDSETTRLRNEIKELRQAVAELTRELSKR